MSAVDPSGADGLQGRDGTAVPPPAEPMTRPVDPERGLRGAMSATLVLEAMTILLALPVAAKTSGGVGPVGVTVILLLAVLHIAGCVYVRRPWALAAILVLQVFVVAGWFINSSLGVMGVVFGAVWGTIAWFRYEYRRRLAAGTLPSQNRPAD